MRFAPLATITMACVVGLGACTGTITNPDDDLGDEHGSTDGESTGEPGTGPSEPGPMITLTPAESSDDLINPERGFYLGYDLRGGEDPRAIRSAGHALAIAVVKLQDYRDRSLDGALLDQLTAGFARARAAGIKIVLRFSYNSAFDDDAPKARVLQHIGQLAPVLRANADVIAVMQAGFIGAWGEWHSSTNDLDNDDDRADVLDALLAALPSSRAVQVRTPMFKAAYLPGGAATEAEAFTGTPRARIGHHNDCFLASDSDLGTYASPVATWTSYVAADSRYTPIGGETCAVYTARTNCEAALAQLEAHHWSYLNREYNANVIASWVSGGCDGDIRRRLGYRFVLRRVAHSEAVAPGGVLALEVDVRNKGFAAPFNRRPVEVVLTDGTTRHVARLAEADARRWPAGEKITLTARLRIPADLAPGTYTLALRLPDETETLAGDPRYAIQLANQDTWDERTGDNVLTRALVIDAAAPGPRDASATDFSEVR